MMYEDVQYTTYGLIGNPLTHSLSPIIHNTTFQELQIEAIYELFSIEESELKEFIIDLKEKNKHIFGLNITVPYKEKVIPYMDSLSPLVKKVGSMNTIVIDSNRNLIGHNTDIPGFLSHLEELKFDIKKKKIVILGAGGAGTFNNSRTMFIRGRK